MNRSERGNRLSVLKLLLAAALAVIVVLTALRFIHLGADPPSGVTRSGVFYTDEGWYSRNAISRYLGGPWIVEGDFNPAVNMPVLQAVNYMAFRIGGMGLAQARVAGAVAFVLTLMLLALALRGRIRREALLIILLLLSSNFLLFTFSRAAIAENVLVFFVVASMYFAVRSHGSRPVANAALAALCLALAVLTKLIAVFFAPVLVFLLWRSCGGEEARHAPAELSFKKLMAAAVVLCVVLGGYFILAVIPNMGDFKYFNALNIARRIKRFGDETAMMKAVYVLKGSSLRAQGIGFIVYLSGMVSILVVLFTRRLWREPLMRAMALWVVCYMAIIAINGYAPPRYYIPVMIPLTIVMVRVVSWLPWGVRGRFLAPALAAAGIALIGIMLVSDALRVARYVGRPEYTFRDMSRRVGEIARGEQKPALLGHFANSISLEAGLPSYNDSFRTWPIERLVARYEPRYYVCYGPVEEAASKEEYFEAAQYMLAHYRLAFIERFDVLDNYYRGVPVYLYRIE